MVVPVVKRMIAISPRPSRTRKPRLVVSDAAKIASWMLIRMTQKPTTMINAMVGRSTPRISHVSVMNGMQAE